MTVFKHTLTVVNKMPEEFSGTGIPCYEKNEKYMLFVTENFLTKCLGVGPEFLGEYHEDDDFLSVHKISRIWEFMIDDKWYFRITDWKCINLDPNKKTTFKVSWGLINRYNENNEWIRTDEIIDFDILDEALTERGIILKNK